MMLKGQCYIRKLLNLVYYLKCSYKLFSALFRLLITYNTHCRVTRKTRSRFASTAKTIACFERAPKFSWASGFFCIRSHQWYLARVTIVESPWLKILSLVIHISYPSLSLKLFMVMHSSYPSRFIVVFFIRGSIRMVYHFSNAVT